MKMSKFMLTFCKKSTPVSIKIVIYKSSPRTNKKYSFQMKQFLVNNIDNIIA